MTNPDVAWHLTDGFIREGHRVADALREAADRIDRRATPQPSVVDTVLDHNYAANQIIHEIQGLVGNLPLGGLLSRAAEADRYLRSQPDD
jgi:hypothetical protein